MSLRAKFSILISTLVLVVVVSSGALHIWSERQALIRESAERREAAIDQLAKVTEESLYQNDVILINYFQTLRNEPAFVAASFVDQQGLVRNSTNLESMGKPFNGSSTLSRPVSFSGHHVGTVHIVWDAERTAAALNAALKKGIERVALIGVVSLILGLFGSFILANKMAKPVIDELQLTVRKMKELDQMKQDFVNGTTHELRSPLTAIDSFAHMILNQQGADLGGENRNFLMAIQNNSKRLMILVDNLLQTARLESGREDFERTQFDLAELTQDVSTLYKPLSQQKKVALKVQKPAAACYVWGDRDKTMQVVNNLISNAFKFTDKGSVELNIFARDGKGWVQVKDSGSGIPETDRAHVFEKFYRSQSNRKQAKGTGLGLTIVKGIVEGQGGEIRVEANPSGGSVFTFSVPS